MAFDRAWEDIFRGRGWGRYPSEEVVRFTARRFFDVADRSTVRILDLGCGGGAHTWFLAREGFDVTAVDGSPAAIERTGALLEQEACRASLNVQDFVALPFPDAAFDAVIDSASIQHNAWDDIVAIHREVFRLLKPGGSVFSTMLNDCSDIPAASGAGTGRREFNDFRAGSIDRGVFVHLFSRAEITMLMADYEEVVVDEVTRTDGGGAVRLSHYVVVARKAA